MDEDRDLTHELLKGIYSDAAPGDLRETYLRPRRGEEGGVRLGRDQETTKDVVIETERTLFLLAVTEVAPKVLRSLRCRLLPVFKRRDRRASPDWLMMESQWLRKWSIRWQLGQDWLRRAVLDTLAMWERDSRSRKALQWALPSQSVRVPRRLRKVSYATPMKRARAGKGKTRRDDDPLLHYKWTVMYQCLKMDPNEIAQAYTDADPAGNRAITTSAIRKAIMKTAHRVGLVLRPGELSPSPGLPPT